MGFRNDLNQNYAALRGLLREWIVGLIHDERPMWRDDGVDVGRGNIFDVHGTCTKSGDVITLTNVVAAGDADTLDSLHATSFVTKSLFDAQSVLAATADDTPAALTLAEQTLVGRLTGGNVAAVSMGIADNNVVQIDDAAAADDQYARFTASGIEGRSVAEAVSDLGALTTAAHTAIGDGAPHHAQSHDHSAAGDGQTLQPLNYKWPAATKLIIATGDITVTQSHHTIQTEDGASTDDVEDIVGLVNNQWYLFRPAYSDTVVFKHAVGNIRCVGNADIILDDLWDYVLVYALSSVAYAFSVGFPHSAVPGGELGGTWASPTVDATHSGSAHHTRSHTLASASDHTGTADRVIYIDHAGAVQELALGADGTVLTSTGAATAPAFEAAPGGGVATDPIWDAAGDLAVGSGADTAARLAKGTDGKVLTMVAGAVAWAAATGGGGVSDANFSF